METSATAEMEDPAEEIDRLVRTLHQTQQRLQELAGGEVDAVLYPGGFSYLLHEAQEKLRESEERFRSLYDAAAIGIAVSAPDGRFLQVNAAYCSMLDYTESELRMLNFMALTHPDDLALNLKLRNELLTGKRESYALEKRYLKKNGEIVWARTSVSVVHAKGGEITRLIVVAEDITERKRIEARLRRLVDSNAQSVFFWNTKGEITQANEAFLQLTRYNRKDLESGRINWTEMTLPEYTHLDQHALKELAATGVCSSYEKEWIRRDGTRVPILLAAAMFEDNPDEGVCFVVDITERKRAEDELRLKTAFLEAQVHSALDGMLVVDREGKKLLQNQRLNELWKIPTEISADLDDAAQRRFAADQTKNPVEFLARTAYLQAHPNEISRDEIELVDGTILDRYSAPVLDESGKCFGRTWIFRDVTLERNREIKLTEAIALEKEHAEKARAGEKAKSDFLAVMSHEIRTPMNGVLGFAEMLVRSPDLTPEDRDLGQTICASGESLLRILDDILDFSGIEAGRLAIQKIIFAPGELVREVEGLLRRRIQEKGLQFLVSMDSGLPEELLGDVGRIRQILLNLLDNALKFTERGVIELKVGRCGQPGVDEMVEFVVHDTGEGISDDQADNVFEPFTQGDSSISRQHGGTGLGLAISRRLAELMGGDLKMSHRGEKGSEFTLRVPLISSETPTEQEPEAVRPVLQMDAEFALRHPLRILVVEDDKVNLKLIVKLLSKLGYDPLSALNGGEATDVYTREHPDCVLMDIQMPGMDGIEATRKIRALERSLALRPAFISALTANILPEHRSQCLKAGMNAYLNKPVKGQQILDIMVAARKFRKNLAH